jgi:hypothetical protein
MLKPYVCVACEKVIVAKDSDVPSLIGLFSKMTIVVSEEVEIPKDAVAPKEWYVFSIWDTEPGDEQGEYVLCTRFLYPDKTQFGQIAKQKIPVEPGKRSQMVMQVQGFPIGQIGQYTVLTWVEEKEQLVVGPIEFKVEFELVRQPAKPLAPPALNF